MEELDEVFSHLEVIKQRLTDEQLVLEKEKLDLQREEIISYSILQTLFESIIDEVVDIELLSEVNPISKDFVLQKARTFMGLQKEIQNQLERPDLPELNVPFQNMGVALKSALIEGDHSHLEKSCEDLKQLPFELYEAGLITL